MTGSPQPGDRGAFSVPKVAAGIHINCSARVTLLKGREDGKESTLSGVFIECLC